MPVKRISTCEGVAARRRVALIFHIDATPCFIGFGGFWPTRVIKVEATCSRILKEQRQEKYLRDRRSFGLSNRGAWPNFNVAQGPEMYMHPLSGGKFVRYRAEWPK